MYKLKTHISCEIEAFSSKVIFASVCDNVSVARDTGWLYGATAYNGSYHPRCKKKHTDTHKRCTWQNRTKKLNGDGIDYQ